MAGTYIFADDALSKPRTWLNLKFNKHTVNKVLVFSVDKEELLIQIKKTNIVKLKSGNHVKVVNEEGGILHNQLYLCCRSVSS